MTGAECTKIALQEFSFALPAPYYLIRMVPVVAGAPIITRNLAPGHFTSLNEVRFARYKNANDYHVYGRPIVARHVLIDDLTADAMEDMARDGIIPNVVVETSPKNFQAWVTLYPQHLTAPGELQGTPGYAEWCELAEVVSDGDVRFEIAAHAARILAKRYGGDPGSAKAMQLGRLPEFTNRKPMYEMDDGRYPWVRIARRTRQTIGLGVPPLLREAIAAAEAAPPSPSPFGACELGPSSMTAAEAQEIYAFTIDELRVRFSSLDMNDRSEADFHIARRLHYQGLDINDVAQVIRVASAKAQERGETYITSTVRNGCH